MEFNNNGELNHKTGQFFSVIGLKIKNAYNKKRNWDQPILNQKHGGILAILTRKRGKVIEFYYMQEEPGDHNLKLCPSFLPLSLI